MKTTANADRALFSKTLLIFVIICTSIAFIMAVFNPGYWMNWVGSTTGIAFLMWRASVSTQFRDEKSHDKPEWILTPPQPCSRCGREVSMYFPLPNEHSIPRMYRHEKVRGKRCSFQFSVVNDLPGYSDDVVRDE
ncbi:MAG: hypothetical protein ACREQ5_00625 [Candidatus Dormibacteria bacterium]